MSYLDEAERAKRGTAAARRADKRAAEQRKADVEEVFALASARRLLAEFCARAGLDNSAFAVEPALMGHNVGLHDGARWWLELLREYCPAREHAMRTEARERANAVAREIEAARGASQDDDDDNPE